MIAKPIKPYPAMKDSGVPWLGEVPKHWRLPRLGALLRERGETNGDGRVSEVLSVLRERGVIPYAEKGNIGNRKSEDITRYKVVRLDDIVVNCMNVIIGSVGISSYIGCLSPVYYVLTRRSERDHPGYLNAYFQTQSFQESLVRIGNGILAHRMRIPMELLKCEPFPRPPSEEQAAIVRFLDHADRRIRRYIRAKQRLIASLEEQKQAIIHQAVTGQVDVRTGRPYPAYKPSGVEWLGDVPENWEIHQLGRIGRFFKGIGGTKEDEVPSGVPCVRYGDLYMQHQYFIRESRSQVSEQRVVDYTPIQYGDVLFAGSGETIEEIGKSAVNLISRHACCGGDVIIFRSQIEVDASFLGYATDCPQAAHQKSCMGRGITVMHIYGDELKYMWVAIPPISEQAAIGRCLNEANADIAAAIDRARKQIVLWREYRTRLIADVVTGKLDVREAATGLPEVDLLADEFDVLTEAPETGMMELEDANETPEELAMENEATV